MELEHSFTVPVPRSRAWDVLLDVERVAPCMPGATLDSVDGDEIRGKIKVKVGPINMVYAGTARFIEKDADAGIVTLEASGKETRGSGTASASVHSVLEDRGEETHVKVRTTLNVTGKPAQFGRGVMNEVSGKLLNIFAANLAATIARDESGDASADGGSGAPAAGAGAGSGADAGAASGAAGSEPAAAGGGSAAGPGTGNGASAATSAATASPANANGSAIHTTSADLSTPGGGTSGAKASSAGGTSTPVEELSLPARATASLHRGGLHTAGDLAAKTEQELLAMDGIGPASLVDIKAKLGELGLSLASSGTADAAAGAADASPAGTPSPAAPPAPAQAAVAPAAGANVAAHRTTPREAAHQLEEDSLNLLKVAGLPVLKRAAPVLAAVGAAVIIGLTRKLRHRKR